MDHGVKFFLISLIVVIPTLLSLKLLLESQRRYLKSYRKKVNPPYPVLPEEMSRRYWLRPHLFLVEVPIITVRLLTSLLDEHHDAELAQLANDVKRRWLFMLITVLAASVVMVFIMIGIGL